MLSPSKCTLFQPVEALERFLVFLSLLSYSQLGTMNLQEDLQNASRWLKIACSSTLHLPPTSPIFNVATISRLSTRDIIPLISSKKRVGTLDYKVTVCKGQKLNGLISDVLEGRRTPSHDYGPDDIRNGWSREGLSRGIPDTFDVPFKAIGKILPDVGERLPELSETHVVDLVQDMPFRNSAGKKQKVRRYRMLPLRRERSLTSYAHSQYLKRTA